MWVDGATGQGTNDGVTPELARQNLDTNGAAPNERAIRPPQLRSIGEPSPTLAADGRAAVRYSFELRSRGNPVRLSAAVEVMSSDGGQVEAEHQSARPRRRSSPGSILPVLSTRCPNWMRPATISTGCGQS